MPGYCQRRNLPCGPVIWLAVILMVCTWASDGLAQPTNIKNSQRVIAVDPGHGGNDTGAKGPDGSFEKTVTLNLARILASELGNVYKVVLTRTDDYGLEIADRTSVANHAAADLFISLHTGGSFLHQASGMSVYYFDQPSGSTLAPDPDLSKSTKPIVTQIPWERLQSRHKTTSSVLAELIRNRINEQVIFLNNKVQGAQLVVLEGADMPAILIEVGYLSNPAEEKSLLDINTLSAIAKGIHQGIDDFFEKVR